MANSEKNETQPAPSGSIWGKVAVLAVVVALAAVGYWKYGDWLTLENLAASESKLREAQETHPVLVYGIAFLIYVAVTGLSLPGAAVLTLAFGWYFGLVRGTVMVSFASTTGATFAFFLSRYFFRDFVQQRFGERLRAFNEALDREGAFYLFTLRLIPAVPFFVINVVMGLTRIPVRTFWWVSQVGMLAGTIVYVYAGSSIPNLAQLADSSQLRIGDVKHVRQLATRIESSSEHQEPSPEFQVWTLMSDNGKELVRQIAASEQPIDPDTEKQIISEFNTLIQSPQLLLQQSWQQLHFSAPSSDAETDQPSGQSKDVVLDRKVLTKVNRTMLVAAFPESIRPPRPILSVQLMVAFVLLGIFPLAVKKVMARFRMRNETEDAPATNK